MVDRIEEIRKEAADAIGAAQSTAEVEELRVRYLGRKADLTQILRGIAELPKEERGPVGKAGNEARQELEDLLESRGAELDTHDGEVARVFSDEQFSEVDRAEIGNQYGVALNRRVEVRRAVTGALLPIDGGFVAR